MTLSRVIEALLFSAQKPLSVRELTEAIKGADPQDEFSPNQFTRVREAEVAAALEQLKIEYIEQQRAFQLSEKTEGWQLATDPKYAQWMRQLFPAPKPARLSAPALETLAIIAYRQPVSRPEVDAARGVNSEGVLDNLLERRLVRIAGRKDSAGRPFLYETTREFLVAFGLRDLGDLPKVDGELILVDPAAAAETAVGEADAPDTAHADAIDAARAAADPVIVEAAASEAAAIGPASAERAERAAETGDVTAATDSHQQDPGPEGTELAPRG